MQHKNRDKGRRKVKQGTNMRRGIEQNKREVQDRGTEVRG